MASAIEDPVLSADTISRRASAPTRVAIAAVAGWGLVVFGAIRLGDALIDRDVHIVLPTPPILGEPVGASVAGLLLAGLVGSYLALTLPRVVSRCSWRRLLVLTCAASIAWWVSLGLAEGASGLTRGPSWPTEYLHDVPAVREHPGEFLAGFTDTIGRYEIHVRGHPPGMVLALAGLDALGLAGARWEAVFVLAVAATAPAAVLLALREVAGEHAARRAGPFLALAPGAIWIATSADAVYMALGAWAVALIVLATGRTGRRAVVLACGAGVFAAAALLGSYGMVLMAAVAAPVVLRRRRLMAPVVATLVAVALLATLGVSGYWWPAGLRATYDEYQTLDIDRPYWAFLAINLGAWALALGPATAAGLVTSRDNRIWLLTGGGVAAAMLANVSGLSEGEVERIWLPFGLWVLPAGAALATTIARARPWLLLQVGAALIVVSQVRTQW